MASKLLVAAQRERRVVAVEFEAAAIPGRRPDVEAGGQAEDDAVAELDRRDDQVRAADPEGLAAEGDPVRHQVPAPGTDRAGWSEHRGDQGQRVDPDIDEHADVVERRRGRVPALDPAHGTSE